MSVPIFSPGNALVQLLLTLVALMCFAATPASAEQLPLWEAGAGIGAARIPHYRGSDEYQTWALPVPYLVYRGEFLRVDESRYRGLFYESGRAELDLSLSGTPPAHDDKARQGMPDLDATFEFGPTLNISLLDTQRSQEKLELRLPVRSVIATDFSHYRQSGWIFQPNLNLALRNVPGLSSWELGLRGDLIFTSRRYNRYFYAVDPAFATPDRPAYDVGGGYAGTTLLVSLSKRYPDFWLGGFAKWDSVGGATFEESPLVKTKYNFTAGFAFAWILSVSPEKVDGKR
jgi:outer membrane protein